MKEESISVGELVAFFARHFWVMTLCLLLGGTTGVVITLFLPKTFKSTSSIAIQSSYFRNPLVSDIISEEHDQSELRAQREALLRLALSDSFLDTLAADQHIYDPTAGEEKVRLERTLLRQQIEYFSLNPTTYTIGVRSGSREGAQSINEEILKQVMSTLESERLKTLTTTRNAIRSHVKSAAETLKELEAAANSRGVDDIQDELARVNADLETLELHFTDKHPKVFALKRQQSSLQHLLDALEKARSEKASLQSDEIPLSGAAKEPMQDVYNDLMKKLSYLNILLEMENAAGDSSHVAVIEQPSFPLSAVSPKSHCSEWLACLSASCWAWQSSLCENSEPERSGSLKRPLNSLIFHTSVNSLNFREVTN